MVDVDQMIQGVTMIQGAHLTTLHDTLNAEKNLPADRLVIATLSTLDKASAFVIGSWAWKRTPGYR